MQVAIPLFPKFTALDGIGPYEVLQRIPSIDVTFIGHQRGEVRSENGMLGITIDATFEDMPNPDIVVFLGGVGTRPLVDDERVLAWVPAAHESTTYTTSVCTGSLVLGAAGLLKGLTATTYWAAIELEVPGVAQLARSSNIRAADHHRGRFRGSTWHCAGRVARGHHNCRRVMMIEYDPQPPFDNGALDKCDDEIVTRVIEYAQARK
jgi:putative intracellular protease/amidase